MSSIKDEAKSLIDGLPEGASWDDIMYQLYVKQKIEAAIAAADAGRVLSHDEVRKRVLGSAD
jgi:predicted transcriptional regulator